MSLERANALGPATLHDSAGPWGAVPEASGQLCAGAGQAAHPEKSLKALQA